jgi:hypothetical protein
MDEDLKRVSKTYAARYSLTLTKRLGSGIHGIVLVAQSKLQPGRTALKLHRDFTPYDQEKRVYQRLRERSLRQILGFHIPTLVRFDDALLAIEMTIVRPPFVLDFAGATLDAPMEFSEDVWADWRAAKEEQFGQDWRTVSVARANDAWVSFGLATTTRSIAGSEMISQPLFTDATLPDPDQGLGWSR